MTNKQSEWVTAFFAFGQFLADKQPTLARKTTLALCLPRINYAAAFLALGVIKRSHHGEPVDTQLARIGKLKGCWVSFVEGGRAGVGLLEKVPEDIHVGTARYFITKKSCPTLIPCLRSKGSDTFRPNQAVCGVF
jgi:hypothetical protein